MANNLKIIDLFSGIGGFSLAAHWMGWETLAFCEKDAFCQKVLRKNFGKDILIYDDITEFSAESFRGRCDVVTGGFPCQPFSQAGQRKGKDDERHLFPEMLRVVEEARPRWVVAENVRGLLSIESGQVFEEVAASLEGIGYAVQTFCIPASAVNAPHRRDRIWIIAHADGWRLQGRRRERSPSAERRSASGKKTENDRTETKSATSVFNGNIASDSESARRQQHTGKSGGTASAVRREIYDGRQASQTNIFSGNCSDVADSASERLPFAGLAGIRQLQTETGERLDDRFEQSNWSENWLEAATRFCRVDAIVPDKLDEFGSRDNRTARLKSLGNGIVPQIAYEIFKAIQQTDLR